jgi:hypothetical protein
MGSDPSDCDDHPFEPQGVDIGTPPDLSESLNTLDASWSDLQSSNGKNTKGRRIGDAAFGMDKPDVIGGYSIINTNPGTSSNSMYNDMLSTHISARELRSIDPRMPLCDQRLGEDTRLPGHHQQGNMLISMHTSSEAASGPPSQVVYPNDFDLALRETGTTPGTTEPGLAALSWVGLWISQHAERWPIAKELKCLEVLAGVPGKDIMSWLKKHVRFPLERHGHPLQQVDETRQYRPKCLTSRPRKIQSGETRLFECTNRCGQTFSRHRKGDWARHERINFEEWVCHVCSESLSRKDHLCDHLRDGHEIRDTNLNTYRHQILASMDRPCGFCRKIFPTWLAWLAHVAAHFEGTIGDRKWKMSKWKERKDKASGSRGKSQPSGGYHDDGGDQDDDDDDNGGNGGGGGDDNSGWSHLNSSHQPPYYASGVDTDKGTSYSFGSPYTLFNRDIGGTNSREYGRVERAHSLHPIDQIAPIDHTQELVGRMAVLDVSDTVIESASNYLFVHGQPFSTMERAQDHQIQFQLVLCIPMIFSNANANANAYPILISTNTSSVHSPSAVYTTRTPPQAPAGRA